MNVIYRTSQAAGKNSWKVLWVPNDLRPKTKENNKYICELIEDDHQNETCHEHYRGYIWRRTRLDGINPRLEYTLEVLKMLRTESDIMNMENVSYKFRVGRMKTLIENEIRKCLK